jgi:hypothetical protein
VPTYAEMYFNIKPERLQELLPIQQQLQQQMGKLLITPTLTPSESIVVGAAAASELITFLYVLATRIYGSLPPVEYRIALMDILEQIHLLTLGKLDNEEHLQRMSVSFITYLEGYQAGLRDAKPNPPTDQKEPV